MWLISALLENMTERSTYWLKAQQRKFRRRFPIQNSQ
jgi:hypothetical protein